MDYSAFNWPLVAARSPVIAASATRLHSSAKNSQHKYSKEAQLSSNRLSPLGQSVELPYFSLLALR